MKKVIVLFAFALFMSCEKPVEIPITEGSVTFWTTEESGGTASGDTGWILWIDEKEIGPINKPYPINSIDKIPNCGDNRFTSILLREGTHSYKLRRFIPTQPPPNIFTGQIYYFDVMAGGCVIVRATQ